MRAASRPTAWALGAVLLSAGLVRAGDDDPPAKPAADPVAPLQAELDAAYAEARPKLESLGAWCAVQELPVERDAVADALLALDPENERARTWLKFKRQKDGTWKGAVWKAPVDLKKLDATDWTKRRDDAALPLRQKLDPLLVKCDDWRAAGIWRRIVRALADLFPEDEAVRSLNEEVQVAGKWVLKESAATAQGRERISALARKALDEGARSPVLPASASPTAWSVSLTRGGCTMYSSLSQAETEALGAVVAAARSLFEGVFETRTRPKAFRAYFLKDDVENDRFVDSLLRQGTIDEEKAKREKQRSTYWFSAEELVVAIPDPAERMDATVRQALDGVDSELMPLRRAPAWIGEGAEMYLTYLLVGTRLTAFVRGTTYSDEALSRDVADAKSDWVVAARKLVDKGTPSNVPILVSLSVNSMSKEDGLVAYALAAYFLEGRGKDLREILVAMKDKTPFHQALAETCGMDAEALERRFVRWLRETR